MLSKIITSSLVLAAVAAVASADDATTPCPIGADDASSCCAAGGEQPITEIAMANLPTLYGLVVNSSDATALIAAINAEDTTVFGPTDDAFKTLLDSLSAEQQATLDTSKFVTCSLCATYKHQLKPKPQSNRHPNSANP